MEGTVTMPETIKNVITPNDKTIRTVFSQPKAYYIDIYQREYKWKEENVRTLLNDIDVRFSQFAKRKTSPKEIQSDVLTHFEPYFLNTFLTNSTPEYTAIVDGQQRLTTFLLIFIKLYQIIKAVEASGDYDQKTFAPATMENLIYETNDFGEPSKFKIHNENRETAFKAILEGLTFKPSDETQSQILNNFRFIDRHFENYFRAEKDSARYDIIRLTYFISYILDKLTIVEIKIEKSRDVAMIFEVVNDRGLGLKPYEILKGKLIGTLENRQKEEANRIWTELQDRYYIELADDLDTFFKTYFRAKFADSQAEYERFEEKYHYEVYTNRKIRNYFGKFEDPDLLYQRVTQDIKYFAELYLKLRTSYTNEYLIFNGLLDQNQQYLLILSNITLCDPEEDAKITAIAKKFDQFHVTLRLLDYYQSNTFQLLIHQLNKNIRDSEIVLAMAKFDQALLQYLEAQEAVAKGTFETIESLYQFERFQNMYNRWTNFSKYVLMRVDYALSQLLDKPSYVTTNNLRELEERFNKNNRRRYGMHLEHILAYNRENMSQFTNEAGVFDEQRFNQVRNRLGAVLLLKDRQNISSGNDIYRQKCKTYAKSNLIWNEILVDHLDSVDKEKLNESFHLQAQEPNEAGLFPLSGVQQRQKELFNVIKHIWCEE
jgi:uncharacterized protein with ParB-like and HNH nuclease domain